jgi:transcriptional regulator with XRE-family HTH domain
MRRARKSAQPRVTQADLAARVSAYGLNINQATISKIEKGARIVTDIELKAIASSLAVSIGWLVGEDETFAYANGPDETKSKRTTR